MAKIIDLGSLPPDHPIYTGGPEVFSRSRATGAALPTNESDLSEEEADIRAGRKMYIGRAVQNVQFEARAKGVDLGAISPQKIFELVESGVIGNWPSVQALRRILRDAD